MANLELPSNADGVRWEFNYESNALERETAEESFRKIRSQPDRARQVGRLMAWPVIIFALILIIWLSTFVTKTFEVAFGAYLGSDALGLLSMAILAGTYLTIVRAILNYFAKRTERQKSQLITGKVLVLSDGNVRFLENNVDATRKIERVDEDDQFVFITIENGERFVYLPKRIVQSHQLEDMRFKSLANDQLIR